MFNINTSPISDTVIGLHLSKQVCTALELPVQDVTFWIDSTTVGFWIRGQSRKYKTFVAHRIGEIHEETNPVQWKYVPTSSNPADHSTRGLTVTELKENELWWNGPEFLKESRDKWPKEKFAEQNAQVFAEMKPQRKDDAVCFSATQQDESEEDWRLKPSRFSKWYRLSLTKRLELGLSLVRVTAWVHRFVANCRKSKKERVSGELTANELQGVEEIIIREAQMEVYCQEITALKEKKSLPKRSSILNLTPIWKDSLLRSNTRLRYSEDLSEEVKYPIILPKRHPVTKLIVKYHHESEGHQMGVNFTLNHLRERYHVVHGREMVKRTAKECTTCKQHFTGKPGVQQMAPLPNIRLELTMKPFTNCAVDFAGPYLTKQE